MAFKKYQRTYTSHGASKYGPEEELQFQCVDFVNKCCPGVIVHHSPNGAYLGIGGGKFGYVQKLKKLGMLPGFPDLILIWGGGNIAFCELKAGDNKPQDHQEKLLSSLRMMGFFAEWTNSFNGFVAFLKECGVPMIKNDVE